LERVLNSFSKEYRGKELMKIKIIKRAASEKIMAEVPAAENNRPVKTDVRKAAATVKFWVDDLRQKHERERRSAERLFREKRYT
jgi:hypothetical protein